MRTFLLIFLVCAAVMAATGSTTAPATTDDVTHVTDTITIMQGNPCLNGGMFIESENGYNCFCANGFTGNKCQTAVNITCPCPTGYSRGPDSHCYHYNAKYMNVTDAQAYCASTVPGAYMVEINSGIENTHVQKMISSSGWFWLGGSHVSGAWTWTHSGLDVSSGFKHWASGHPTGWVACMFIMYDKWYSDRCSLLAKVVCEYGN